jgi:hypothetical protein
MFFRVVLLFGQHVKQITCRNVWNVSLEKALVFVSIIVEICSIQEMNFVTMYDFVVFFDTTPLY